MDKKAVLTEQNFMATALGYKDVFQFSGGGLDRVRKELNNFNALAVLQFCSKLSLILTAKGQTNLESQAKIIRTIFSKEIRRKFVEAARKSENPLLTVINEKSVALLAKESILHCRQKGGEEISESNSERLGILLLVLNDEGIGQGWQEELIKYPVHIERERLREFLARATFFHGNWYIPNQLESYREIFSHAIDIAKGKNIDLERIFSQAANGLTLTEFYSIGLSVLTNWMQNLTKDPNIEKEWVICLKKYFHKTILPKHKIEAFFKFNGIKIKDFKKLNDKYIEEILDDNDSPVNNFLVFNQRPFIYYNRDCYVCPIPRFLSERISEGVYWIVENYLKQKDSKLHKLWPEIWGKAYERYITGVLKNIYKDSYHENYTDNKGKERADGLITGLKESLPLVEIKYAHWRYKTKVTGNRQEMANDIRDFAKDGNKPKGLGQLAHNIKDLSDNEWKTPDTNANKSRVLPILIVGEVIPMDAYNRKFYEEVLSEEKILFPPQTCLPFIVLSLEDVVILETISENYGKDKATEILENYSKMYLRPNEIGYVRGSMGFKNFSFTQNGIEIGKNLRLWGGFDELFVKVKKVVFGSSGTTNMESNQNLSENEA